VFIFRENNAACLIDIDKSEKAINHSITAIIKNKLVGLLDFCGYAGDTLELEAILLQMYDICVHFGSMYKHYNKLTSQLLCEIHFKTFIDVQISQFNSLLQNRCELRHLAS